MIAPRDAHNTNQHRHCSSSAHHSQRAQSIAPPAETRAPTSPPDASASEVHAPTAQVLDQATLERAAELNRLLEERITLSAQMLKAFQTQVARVDDALHAMQQSRKALTDLNARIGAIIQGAQQRLNATADRAVREAEARLREETQSIRNIEDRLAAVDERLRNVSAGVDAIDRPAGRDDCDDRPREKPLLRLHSAS